MLTSQEKAALVDSFDGDKEAAADAYASWKANEDAFNPWFAKVRDFFRNLRDKIHELFGSGPSVEGTFSKIRSGEVWNRSEAQASEGGVAEAPAYQAAAKKSIYSDDRSVKMTFEETGVEPSLTDRPQLRKYLESINPAEVKALKSSDPDAYIDKLKEIVKEFFPDGGNLRFRTENGVFDYDHFLKDRTRQDYIETLPKTLKDEDIRVEFTTKDGEAKAYLIKKYFDPEVQKDIWDSLVFYDGELQTKFVSRGAKGEKRSAKIISTAEAEASHSTTPPGNLENAPTPDQSTNTNIAPDGTGVNPNKPQYQARKKDQKALPAKKRAPVFFSKLQQVIEEKMPNAASASDVRALLKSQGVKADEIRWTGIEHLLSGKEKLTKEEVRSWVEANAVEVTDVTSTPKFEQYTMPGKKEGYTELLLTIAPEAFEGPATKALGAFQVEMARKYTGKPYGTGWANQLTPDEKNRHADLLQKAGRGDRWTKYEGGHYSETPNVLAHIRFDERQSPSGGRMLFIEEIQSDWHQQGREKGYKTDALPDGVEFRKNKDGQWELVGADGKTIGLGRSRVEAIQEARVNQNEGRVPDAPFKNTWPELALKRMIRYAAENGFDSIGWTTGRQQADRYNLAKYIDELKFGYRFPDADGVPDGTIWIEGWKGNRNIIDQEGIAPEKLSDYVGKETAEKILKQLENSPDGEGELTGLDLQVGGHGMVYFYDKMIPSFLEKYGKKWGVKVEKGRVNDGSKDTVYRLYEQKYDGTLKLLGNYRSEEAALEGRDRIAAEGMASPGDISLDRMRIVPDTGLGYRIYDPDTNDLFNPEGSTFPTYEDAVREAHEMAMDLATIDGETDSDVYRETYNSLEIRPVEAAEAEAEYRIVADFLDTNTANERFPSVEAAREAAKEYVRDIIYDDPSVWIDYFSGELDASDSSIRDGYHRRGILHPACEEAVENYINDTVTIEPVSSGGPEVHSIKVTPAMKEEVLTKGQPQYQIKRKAGSPPFIKQLRVLVADEKEFPDSLKSASAIETLVKYGVTDEELQNTGLLDFLSDKPHVSRRQLLGFIDENAYKIALATTPLHLGERALKRDSEEWGKRVDALEAEFEAAAAPNKEGVREVINEYLLVPMLNQTPLVLQMIGAPNLPMGVRYGIFAKAVRDKHNISVESLKEIPAKLADPIMIFRSATREGDYVVMIDLLDQHGATVIVPIELEQMSHKGGYAVNLAKKFLWKITRSGRWQDARNFSKAKQ